VGKAAFHLRPVAERLAEHLKTSSHLFMDGPKGPWPRWGRVSPKDTLPVLDPGRGKTKTGYLWTLARDERGFGGTGPPGVVYAYAPGRGGKHAEDMLEGFAGTLLVDGYGGYIRLVASHIGRDVTPASPIVSAELPGGGERFEGVMPPVAPAPCFAIRRPAGRVITLDEYIASGVISPAHAETLRQAVASRANILLVGGTSSGKTTLANALLAETAGTAQRVVILEDTRELQCAAPDMVALRTQTDGIDAATIAAFLAAHPGAGRTLPAKNIRRIKALSAKRRQLLEMRKALLCQMKQAREPGIIALDEAHLDLVNRQVATLNARIDGLLQADQTLQARRDLLRSIPSIGPVAAATLIADMPELGNLDAKQAASLAGLAPFAPDSGTRQGKRFIRGGRMTVRNVLYMAAMACARCCPDMQAFAQRLRDKGKPHKQVITAVARKLILRANAVLKRQSAWIPARP
jgi:transposase